VFRVDERNTGIANVLVMDFYGSDFDRSEARMPNTDPPAALAFQTANSVLSRIRIYSRIFDVKPLEIHRDAWNIQYLTDEGQQFEKEPGKVRGVHTGSGVIGVPALFPEAIEPIAAETASEEPYSWDGLLLDARAQLPDVGGAVVMASAALRPS
jgi:hypothetical protein